MIDIRSEDEVRDLGRWAGEEFSRAFTAFMFKHLAMETVLEVIPRPPSRYTRAFEYEEKRDGSRTVIVLRHGSGHKYSLFYEEVARALFADLGGRGIRTEPQENAVVLEFSSAPTTVAAEGVSVGSKHGLHSAEKATRPRNVPT